MSKTIPLPDAEYSVKWHHSGEFKQIFVNHEIVTLLNMFGHLNKLVEYDHLYSKKHLTAGHLHTGKM